MSEAHNASIMRVIANITEPHIRTSVEQLLKNSIVALNKLSGLDDAIFQCYKLDDAGAEYKAELDLTVTELRSRILGGTRTLIEYLETSGWVHKKGTDGFAAFENTDQVDLDINLDADFDLAFGDDFDAAFSEARTARSSASLPSLPEMRDIDIDEAFDFLEPESQVNTQEHVDRLRDELTSISFALRDQLDTFEYRLRTAFHQANYSLVIRELDTSREALREGLFAMVSSVFRDFAPDITSLDFLPGYRDILQHALDMRQSLTRLAKWSNPSNAIVQNMALEQDERTQALHSMIELLENFIESPGFRAMQAPERWEFVNFARNMRVSSFRKAAQSAEGFVKYVESLMMMAPSEIITQHDQETIRNIHELLGAVRSLLLISPASAKDMLLDSLDQAHRLYGRDPYLDEQLEKWAEAPPNWKDNTMIPHIVERLERLLRT